MVHGFPIVGFAGELQDEVAAGVAWAAIGVHAVIRLEELQAQLRAAVPGASVADAGALRARWLAARLAEIPDGSPFVVVLDLQTEAEIETVRAAGGTVHRVDGGGGAFPPPALAALPTIRPLSQPMLAGLVTSRVVAF